MNDKIPVPTDNIFKFYALFGLVLFVFSVGSLLYVNSSTNEFLVQTYPELEGLKSLATPSPAESAKAAILERRLEIAISDKKTFLVAAEILVGIALFLMIGGFFKWHRDVQPLLDETARTQLEIAKLQLEKLRRELNGPVPSSEAKSASETPLELPSQPESNAVE